ncbi:hypothetical protein DPMN_048711 [Dreissena polymorpha]|uniref:Uncharacterized protein n=1 Tax=Dreissena polymorpha TaxID=45954 RepID=A0A9D4DCV9_DREPO|nr:hypothetical protein DPMN_048711 [Dreissena polymorpha]
MQGSMRIVWLSHYTFQERDGRERDSELTSVENIRGGPGDGNRNIEEVALENGSGTAVLSALNALGKPSRG